MKWASKTSYNAQPRLLLASAVWNLSAPCATKLVALRLAVEVWNVSTHRPCSGYKTSSSCSLCNLSKTCKPHNLKLEYTHSNNERSSTRAPVNDKSHLTSLITDHTTPQRTSPTNMYPHARLLALLMLMISNTLTAARPVWMEVPQDLNHDGKNDWNDVTVSVSPTHEKGPKHPWPFYTLEIHMEDNKRIMDQSSSLHSACEYSPLKRLPNNNRLG